MAASRPALWHRNLNAKVAAIPMIATALVVFIGGTAWTVVYSFTNSKLLPREKFVGFDQYERLWSSNKWLISIENLAIYGAFSLVFSLLIGFVLAALLDQKIRFEDTFRTILLYPFALSFIVTGLAWQWILNPDFGVQQVVRNLGWESFTFDPLYDPDIVIYGILIAGLWQGTGLIMCLMLAGLRGIDEDIWKAARVDGIPMWKTYLFIVIPMMRGIFITAIVLIASGIIKVYDLVVAQTGGGPGIASEVPAKYVYDAMFLSQNLGQGFAASTMMLLTVAIIVVPWAYLEFGGKRRMPEIRLGNIFSPPVEVTFQPWVKAWAEACTGLNCDGLSRGFFNSVKILVPSVILSIIIASINGYALANWRFKGSETFFTILIVGAFIPYQVMIYPIVIMLREIGLYGSLTGLVIVHTIFGMPILTLLFRNYFASVPQELFKAARVDGAGFWGIYFQIMVPMSLPIFVVAMILQVTGIWNDFLFGVIYTKPDLYPMTVQLNNIVNSTQGVKEYNVNMAATILTGLVPLTIYFISGKLFVRGIAAGASTLLNCIAGLLDISGGQILIGGNNVTWEEPSKRGIGMVFQSYALYPQMSVRGNMSFGLKNAGLLKSEVEERVNRAAKILQIEPLLDRKPAALSGGQRQRVAIGRALVRDVDVFLFDEPLSNLDAKLRTDLRVEIKRLHHQLKSTMIYVTHDQIEALTLADRIAVMKGGKIQQLASPYEIYNHPANLFVARFVGSPTMNLLEGSVRYEADVPIFSFAQGDIPLAKYPGDPRAGTSGAILGIRPEHFTVHPEKTDDCLKATVDLFELMGADNVIDVRLGDVSFQIRIRAEMQFNPGDTVYLTVDEARATVPGCVHTDLLAAGAIPDPYLDCNELAVQWIGECDWAYETKFDADLSTGNRHMLVFHGLDTVATVTLNGTKILSSENMHRTYRVDVTETLRMSGNELRVEFLSPYEHEKQSLKEIAPRPNCYPGPGNLMRKMACNFGWDWGPTLVTAGIWRNVDLVSWTTARFDRVRTDVSLSGRDGRVRIHAGIQGETKGLELQARIGDHSVSIFLDAPDASLELTYPAPSLWWPHGMGAQPLYDLEIVLKKDGQILDAQTRRIGFRSIDLDLSGDEDQSAFTFIVNGKPIFIFGANWIPDDCFPSRITRTRLQERITQARDANINMLRVWGGGIYESDDFYDLCDEAGILVWQDFLFACAAYPEEGTLPAEVEGEARDNIERLMSHPSLAIWNGNNENIWGFQAWGWQEPLDGKTWGEGYYLDLLPKLVTELHPSGIYYPGSPYSGSMDRFANADEHGCRHIWDVWNEVGYEVYADYAPRFVSEFGWQAPPTMATLTGAISDENLSPTSPGVMHHQKASEGNEKLLRGLAGHLPEPQNFEDWHFSTQLNQAHAILFGISHFRALQPVCMGAIVWQLNDCWPVTSWAAIDGYGRKKPLWYALKKAYAPRFLTIGKSDDGLTLHVINDANLEWRTPLTIRRLRFDGTVLAEHIVWRVCVERNKPVTVDLPDSISSPSVPGEECIVVTAEGGKATHFFAEDIDLDLPEPRFGLKTDITGSAPTACWTPFCPVRN
eukprot:g2055.t1